MKFLKRTSYHLLLLLTVILVLVAVKGLPGDNGKPLRFQEPADHDTYPTSPFEVTNSNSRFALIESIVERHEFFFNDAQAKFSAPDIVYYKDRFFSIFTPGISFLAIPLYLIGKVLGLTQFVTFLFNILALFLNLWLISKLARAYGAGRYTSLLVGLIYVFATNSLAYSLALSQHQFSATLVLLALLNATTSHRTVKNNFTLGLWFSLGVLVDIPNFFAMLPMLIYASLRHFDYSGTKLKLNLNLVVLFLSLLPLFGLFAWYNYSLTGSWTLLGQVIGRSDYPPKPQPPIATSPDNPFGYIRPRLPLRTRIQTNGFYQLLFSNERGWFFYSPIMALGLLGIYLGLKSESTHTLSVLGFSSIFVTVLVYSMHGDPWGGWAFGSRYMIPSSAIAAGGLALCIASLSKRLLFTISFITLAFYSVVVSVSGALTTTLVPPKVEAVYFEEPQPYTFELNLNYIFKRNTTGSLVYHLWFNNRLDVKQFYILYVGSAFSLISISYIMSSNKA